MSEHLILISLIVLGFVYWFHAQKIKELALAATHAHCLAMDVQMLDDYIAEAGLSLKRDNSSGKLLVERTFLFEFSSTGDERYNGKIIMRGERVASIYLEPHRINLN